MGMTQVVGRCLHISAICVEVLLRGKLTRVRTSGQHQLVTFPLLPC